MKKYISDYRPAQGEILFIKIDKIPNHIKKIQSPDNYNRIIVGHSETGHHHVIERKNNKQAQMFIDEINDMIAYLKVGDKNGVDVKHLRNNDTHKTIHLPVGDYMIRYRAEDTPEGWKRVAD